MIRLRAPEQKHSGLPGSMDPRPHLYSRSFLGYRAEKNLTRDNALFDNWYLLMEKVNVNVKPCPESRPWYLLVAIRQNFRRALISPSSIVLQLRRTRCMMSPEALLRGRRARLCFSKWRTRTWALFC